jgi:phosphatidylglycerophosphate synthase
MSGEVPAQGILRHVRIWIDATRPQSQLEVFGMTLLERHLRGMLQQGLAPTELRIELAGGPVSLPPDLMTRLPIRFSFAGASVRDRLDAMLRDAAGDTVIAFDADTIIDARLFAHLTRASAPLAVRSDTPDCGGPSAVLMLAAPLDPRVSGDCIATLAASAVERGAVKAFETTDADGYVKRLRRTLAPYVFAVRNAAERDAACRFLFWSNYKGSTDFFTRYVYPFFVWRALPPLARHGVHPNVVTLFNVVITVAAIPLWASGWWVSGFLCAYGMSVLDSVDGKLARLTFRSSELGHRLDHGLDLVHPPFWYFAWAWALSGGNPGSLLFQSSVWMAVVYFLDRVLVRVFTRRTNRSIHAFAPIDVRMRTIISRRNINLPLFTIGLSCGLGVESFVVIVAWQVASFAFHLLRVAQCWNVLANARQGSAANTASV